MPHSVATYQPEFKEAFRHLNLEWIEKYFRVEPKDLEQVDNPEVCVTEGGQIFYIVVDGRAVGTCALYKVGPRKFELAKMAVDPEFQGHKFGDRLMEVAENWARAQGADEIILLSNTVLTPAINLYRKHGYEVVHLGDHPDYERCNIEMRKRI